MKKFNFKFKALLHLRESRRDTCRQLLANILAEEKALLEEKNEVLLKKEECEKSIREIGSSGSVDINRISSHRYYVNQLSKDILITEQKLERVGQQAALCRKALSKADQEVKILEKLRDKQEQLFLENESRMESRELEETWQASQLSGGTEL